MTTIIFKSEKKAKTYEVRSLINQGCYKENELMRIVKTDDIDQVCGNTAYFNYTVEINN